MEETPSPDAIEHFLAANEHLFTSSHADVIRGAHTTLAHFTLRELLKRNWVLLEGGLTYGGFICSDEPLVVAPTETSALYDRMWKLDDRNTDVTIALDRDLALLGRYEGLMGNSKVTPLEVASVNTRTFWNNKHMVYSARPDFIMLGPGGTPERASVLVRQGLLYL